MVEMAKAVTSVGAVNDLFFCLERLQKIASKDEQGE